MSNVHALIWTAPDGATYSLVPELPDCSRGQLAALQAELERIAEALDKDNPDPSLVTAALVLHDRIVALLLPNLECAARERLPRAVKTAVINHWRTRELLGR